LGNVNKFKTTWLMGSQISSVTQLCRVVFHQIGMLRHLSMGLYLTAFYQNMSGAVWPVMIGYVTTCVPVGLPLALYLWILTPSLKKKYWGWWDIILFF